MKKVLKSLFVIAAVCFAFASNGQGLVIRAGVNAANMMYEFDGEEVFEDSEALLGLNIGAHAELPLGDMFNFEPGITFNQRGFKIEESDMGATFKAQSAINYVDVPLHVRAKLVEVGDLIISVAAGPYVGFALSGKTKSETTIGGMTDDDESDLAIGNDEEKDDIKPLDFGAGAQAGIEIGNITANIFYTLGLANVALGDKNSATHNVVGAKIGFRVLDN